jgi:2'-5' RNA ligase
MGIESLQGRLFVALELPVDVREELMLIASGVPGAHWTEEENLHLTIRFIGEVDGVKARDLATALRRIEAAPFTLTLSGIGFFPPRGETEVLWMGVEKSEPLEHLHQRVDTTATRLGMQHDRKRWVPHVTLARLHDAPKTRLQWFAAGQNLWKSRPFEVNAMVLMSSTLRPSGAVYRREEVFPFRG